MAAHTTAASRWEELSSKRMAFLTRCELYANYTLPKVCPPIGYDQNTYELSHDFQAVGAQAVNNLANKIMLALFAPSRPFFRADPDEGMQKKLDEAQVSAPSIAQALSKAEKDAVRKLDQIAMRPKMYEVLKHLIVTGNVLLQLDEFNSRVIGLHKYVVRRSAIGELVEMVVGDRVRVDELELDVQAVCTTKTPETEVNHYRWFTRDPNGDILMSQWVDAQRLPQQFDGKWSNENCPYRVLTWDLSDGAHYGTGLVEDYRADFAGLSALSRAQVVGAVLASEFRWLVNPAGMTKPEDLMNSENGAALPGMDGDVTLIQSGKSSDLQTTMAISAEYVNRIGRGFLLGASLVRNAERVTAEEIRLLANELETSLGGAYSRLAVDIQMPMARWLMQLIKLGIEGSGFTPTIVTGLEALSRSGDLEELKALFGDLALLAQIPEPVLVRLKFGEIIKAFGAARRVDVDTFIKTDDEVAQEQQQAQQDQMQMQAAQGAVQAGVQQASAPPAPQGQ